MSSIKHKMGREAFSAGFELAYSKLGKDRQKAILDIFKLAEGYLNRADMKLD